MKGLFTVGFATLALSTIAPAVTAEPATTALTTYKPSISSSAADLSPSELVGLASQGYLREQGIPSSAALITQYQLGTISAKEVVEAAARANRLPAQLAQEPGYLESVNNQLQVLSVR